MEELAGVLIAAISIILGWLIARTQNRLDASTAVAEWRRDIRTWADEAIDVLTEASYAIADGQNGETAEETARKKTFFRVRLSALVDRGRFFLPNEREGDYGIEKAAAYRGLRHAALDPLVAAERILEGGIDVKPFPDRSTAVVGVKREFVSSVQSILDPRSLNKEIAGLLEIARAARKADPTLGGLLPNASKPPTGAAGVIFTAGRRYQLSQNVQKPR